MLTNQHNIHQVSYNEGNFQELSLYRSRALHTLPLNYAISIRHLLIQGAPVIYSATYMGPNFEEKKNLCIFEDHVSGP
jgi:hypothetical protein